MNLIEGDSWGRNPASWPPEQRAYREPEVDLTPGLFRMGFVHVTQKNVSHIYGFTACMQRFSCSYEPDKKPPASGPTPASGPSAVQLARIRER